MKTLSTDFNKAGITYRPGRSIILDGQPVQDFSAYNRRGKLLGSQYVKNPSRAAVVDAFFDDVASYRRELRADIASELTVEVDLLVFSHYSDEGPRIFSATTARVLSSDFWGLHPKPAAPNDGDVCTITCGSHSVAFDRIESAEKWIHESKSRANAAIEKELLRDEQ